MYRKNPRWHQPEGQGETLGEPRKALRLGDDGIDDGAA